MMKKIPARDWGAVARSVFLALLATSIFAGGARILFYGLPNDIAAFFNPESQTSAVAASVKSPFTYDFKIRGTLVETSSPDESSSPYWWLDSGAKLIIEHDVGKTVQGALPALDRWRLRYSVSSAEDTGDGYAPQNLFRLLTRSTWDDVRVESSFRIVRDNFFDSPNRNESNGLFLMFRYKDHGNLYYAGVRVDGKAVIKKKFAGVYYTMAEKQIFGLPATTSTAQAGIASSTYDRMKDINLLPHNEWLSLRSETVTATNGDVTIKLFMKRVNETKWSQLLSATDDGTKFASTTPIKGSHPIGIRTDFMDVEFDNFKAEDI